MNGYQVSISMEPENNSQGKERFKWSLIRYEKKRGFNYPWSIQKQGFASSRAEALSKGIQAYDSLITELSQSAQKAVSVKKMFIDKKFKDLRALANDPNEITLLSCDSLICVILAVAIKMDSNHNIETIEKLLERLILLHKNGETVGSASVSMITDKRLSSPSNANELHELAQVCSLLSLLMSVKKSPTELVNCFNEASRVWRLRAVKPHAHTGKALVTRAYDLMELGEKYKAEETIMMALSKGISGDLLISAGNVLGQVGQYKLAEDAYLKVIDDIKDENLKEIVQEYLNEVREKRKERELISQAAATQTNE